MRLLLILAALLLSNIAGEAAQRCLSRQEARAIYPRDHLFWRTHAGKRCWSSSRPTVAPRNAQRVVDQTPLPAPPPIFLPAELASPIWKPPIQEAFAWEPVEIYSTFSGDPPDVWPTLKDDGMVMAMQFMAIVLGTILSLVVFLLIYLSRRDRLRF